MRTFLLYFLLTFTFLPLLASTRSGNEMQAIAYGKLKTMNKTFHSSKKLLSANQMVCIKETDQYHIYAAQNIGFVIVGKNTLLPEVLGYSNTAYDEDNVPDGLKWWLSQVSTAAANKQLKGYTVKSVTPIEPFVTTRWGQEEPYNLLTPTIGKNTTPSGCVATAMAQAFNYLQYPTSATFTATYYVGENDKTGRSEKVTSTYSYPYKEAYGVYIDDNGEQQTMPYTDEEGTAIATLMRDCGYAAAMQYTTDGSGASLFDAAIGMVNIFKFPAKNVKFFMRDYYTTDEWFDIIRTELENKSPVLYGGSDVQFGGHAFVLAGMDEDGKVFVNWGWDGSSNGFYDITLLNPLLYYFTGSNYVLTGVRTTTQLDCDKYIYQFATDSPYEITFRDDNMMKVEFTSGIYNCGTYGTRYTIAVVAEDTLTKTPYVLSTIVDKETILPMYGFSAQEVDSISYETTLNKGNYQAYIGVKRTSDTQWTKVRSIGGEFYYNITVDEQGKISTDAIPVFSGIIAPRAITTENRTNTFFPGTYNMKGQKVNSDYRGIVIKDGKKVIQR